MLSVADRNGRPVRRLDAAEVEAMLAAFARPGATALARTRGADIVRKVQQRNCWFRCGCLDGTEPAPVLVPVLESHIRRSPHYPDHADGCPFEMGDVGSASHARRLREPEPGKVFRLVGAVRPGAVAVAGVLQPGRRGVHKTHDRDKLSQLLFKLLSDAGVHRVGRGPRGPGEQWEALYRAARGLPLGEGLRLSEVLHTDPGQLGLPLDQGGAGAPRRAGGRDRLHARLQEIHGQAAAVQRRERRQGPRADRLVRNHGHRGQRAAASGSTSPPRRALAAKRHRAARRPHRAPGQPERRDRALRLRHAGQRGRDAVAAAGAQGAVPSRNGEALAPPLPFSIRISRRAHIGCPRAAVHTP